MKYLRYMTKHIFITKTRNFESAKFIFSFFVFSSFRAFVINIYCFSVFAGNNSARNHLIILRPNGCRFGFGFFPVKNIIHKVKEPS